jgi:hypothetical protein
MIEPLAKYVNYRVFQQGWGPVPQKISRKIKKLQRELQQAEEALMAARKALLEACQHPYEALVADSYCEYDTLGNTRGGVYLVKCSICGEVLRKLKNH